MSAATPEQLTRAWRGLQSLVPVTVIRTEQQYDRAITTLQMLIDIVGVDEQHPLFELLDTMGTLIQAYEEQHEDVGVPTNIELIRFLMSEHDLTVSELPELGDGAVVNAILSAKQPVTEPQLHALARRFGVTRETFLAA